MTVQQTLFSTGGLDLVLVGNTVSNDASISCNLNSFYSSGTSFKTISSNYSSTLSKELQLKSCSEDNSIHNVSFEDSAERRLKVLNVEPDIYSFLSNKGFYVSGTVGLFRSLFNAISSTEKSFRVDIFKKDSERITISIHLSGTTIGNAIQILEDSNNVIINFLDKSLNSEKKNSLYSLFFVEVIDDYNGIRI